MRVVVTGGSGFVGRRLNKIKPQWVYISSSQYNLKNKKECNDMLEEYKPDAILHLASKVGGIKENSLKQAEFYHTNTMILDISNLPLGRRLDVVLVSEDKLSCLSSVPPTLLYTILFQYNFLCP